MELTDRIKMGYKVRLLHDNPNVIITGMVVARAQNAFLDSANGDTYIVLLDKGFWNEDKTLFMSYLVVHVSNLVVIDDSGN